MEEQNTIRKKANTYFFFKVAVNALLIVLGAVLISLFLRQMQRESALTKQRQTSEIALKEVVSALEDNARDAADLTVIFHDGNQDMLNNLNELLVNGMFDVFTGADSRTRTELFADPAERSGADYLFILDENGRVFLAPEMKYEKKDPADQGLLTREEMDRLLLGTMSADGTVAPVLADNDSGGCYFYSKKTILGGKTYYLVLGMNASTLEAQISSLKDVSEALSRTTVGNGGFLFAVDVKDGTFLYFVDGAGPLTGENAAAWGLSAEALLDGYAGVETIRGTKYYCVTRSFGDGAAVCAAADMERILYNDRHVVYWSIASFVMVMLLCLAYAIVVRNDFVRNAVDTRKKIFANLRGNPLIFDKSIFDKVFPLMAIGVMVIFALSFYTQTLLEIADSIERSEVALEEMSGRYRESAENRELIRNYYNEHFLSKARLLSYLVEEDPSVLNEPDVRLYTAYDKQGNKEFLTDDEGNRLHSVVASARLQELCESNDLDSVYIFDQNGRTIATNTSNWFFTVSHDEQDQSYEFLQVIDGKKDAFVQEAGTNDLGEAAQYIGVAFTYYTTVDEAGETLYVSRREYLARMSSGEGAPVTAHRSMLQVGLQQELSERLLASTEEKNVLSSNLLGDGFILMFDNSSDHICLYSPREASIGMKAADMGISAKAFTAGDYYGFTRINGVACFLFSRYQDGYCIVAAIPRSSMYQARARIALITSAASFILILILSGTVTFTTEEEEILYATMSDEQAEKGMNSAVFSVILPSGRKANTTKASARWDNRYISWGEKSPEQKLLFMIEAAGCILVLYVITAVVGARTVSSEGSVIRYILNGEWDRGINVFALSACALVLIFTEIIVGLFRIPVRVVTTLLGTRSETIGHLLLSVMKYGGAIGAFFFCMYLIGMDAPGLLASASVLSLIIGLGAQSLIKDIIAGIFIVFEGEFRVGDIVTINGYRGTVMEIGLRTTKIMGVEGNIKIFNNSEISGVLNMTKEASVAMSSISIEYGQDIDYVEAVLERDLPALQENNPLILEGPTYLGVSALGESGVEILIMCKCNEADVKSVTRYLNREVLKIFYRNGINVPFPNVTISRLKTDDRKTIDDFRSEDRTLGRKTQSFRRSRFITVTNLGQGMSDALRITEQFAEDRGLGKRSKLHLRLLAEELLGMLRTIAGETQATYWLEMQNRCFELHLRARLTMTREIREQLLAVSSSGKNEAAKSFMGKLLDVIAVKMMPSEEEKADPVTALMGAAWISMEGDPTMEYADEWSMSQFRIDVESRQEENIDKEEARDELEKSIVARLADDVKISIRGSNVEIKIFKTFPEYGA